MATTALITWIITALGGLYMLATWLIEYESAATPGGPGSRLPVVIIFGHAMLAVTGLVLWVLYLIVGQRRLAWYSLFVLLGVVLLGFTMLSRWLVTYRESRASRHASLPSPAAPAERYFPVAVVLAHGLLGALTLVIVGLGAIAGG